MKHIAYIGIGANLGDRIQNCETAVQKINAHPSIKVTKISSWIETDPIGYLDQGKFINGAIEIETSLTPYQLLKTLQSIENEMGRVRTIKWGPRIIDIDVLYYDDLVNDPIATVRAIHTRFGLPFDREYEARRRDGAKA